jgi:L-fuconolactonase
MPPPAHEGGRQRRRIDAHQHFWHYDPVEYEWIDASMASLRRDFLPADLEPELRAAGFDACVAVQARQNLEETRWLLELAEDHPFIAGVVGWVDLQAADLRAQLEPFADRPKLVGLRHIVQAEPDDRFLLRPEFLRGVASLRDFGLAYDILIYPRHLPAAVEFAQRLEGHRLVLDHLAKPEVRRGEIQEWRRHLRSLSACGHVMAKLSGLVTEADWHAWTPEGMRPYLDVAFECFGYERLMIGSDWPVCTVAADYGRTMRVVTDYMRGRPAREQDAVLGGNAERLWQLDAKENQA